MTHREHGVSEEYMEEQGQVFAVQRRIFWSLGLDGGFIQCHMKNSCIPWPLLSRLYPPIRKMNQLV